MSCCSNGPRCVSCAILESQTRPPLAPGQLWYDPLTCSFKYLSSCSGKLESLSAKPGNGLVYDETTDRWNIDLAEFSGLGFKEPGGQLTILPGTGIKIIDGKVSLDPAMVSPAPAPIGASTINLTPTTPNSFNLVTTDAKGWNVGAGRMSFSAGIRFNNYFAVNPNGHMAIVLRQDPAITNAVRGQGVAIGNVSGAPEGNPVAPGIQAEAWANIINPQENRLLPLTSAKKPIKDNVNYKLLVESSVAPDGNKYVRYALYEQVARGFDLVYDSGDALDTLAGADMTKTGLLIGHVFGSGAGGWSIDFTDAKVTWGPFGTKATDAGSVLGVSGGGVSQAQVDSSIAAALAARTTGNIGFAVRTAAFAAPSTATRTWATVPLDANSANPSFGSWNAAKTEFTFSKAGAYMVNVTGPIGTFYSASSPGGQLSTAAYLNFGTYTHWVGGSAAVAATGSGLVESGWCGASVPVNATVGMVVKLVLTTISTGVTSAQAVFGVADGIQEGGSAASGMSIVPI